MLNDLELVKEKFFVRVDEDILWMYYNPDSNSGGQFVELFFSVDDIDFAERHSTTVDEFFDELEAQASCLLYDIGAEGFYAAQATFNEPPTAIGCTEQTERLLVLYKGNTVLNADLEFLD